MVLGCLRGVLVVSGFWLSGWVGVGSCGGLLGFVDFLVWTGWG